MMLDVAKASVTVIAAWLASAAQASQSSNCKRKFFLLRK
jgi:hypothetical protein